MLLLAFDTATPLVTAALHDGVSVIADGRAEKAMAQGELLAPVIDSVLRDADVVPAELTDIAVGVGPGPFTGLRVGVVTALTLGHTLDIPVHGVCSLDALGARAARDGSFAGDFVVTTDARRKEIYWARYAPDGTRQGPPGVDKPDRVAELGLPAVGRGAELYADVLEPVAGPLDPAAADLAELFAAGKVEVLPPEPLYLRRPDIDPRVLTVPK